MQIIIKNNIRIKNLYKFFLNILNIGLILSIKYNFIIFFKKPDLLILIV